MGGCGACGLWRIVEVVLLSQKQGKCGVVCALWWSVLFFNGGRGQKIEEVWGVEGKSTRRHFQSTRLAWFLLDSGVFCWLCLSLPKVDESRVFRCFFLIFFFHISRLPRHFHRWSSLETHQTRLAGGSPEVSASINTEFKRPPGEAKWCPLKTLRKPLESTLLR